MEKIVFEWHGYVLMEPIGFLFNWFIALQCFFYVSRLNTARIDSVELEAWKWFFRLFGSSTFFGGLSHLLFFYLDWAGKLPGWSCAMLSMAFLELAIFYQMGWRRFRWAIWLLSIILFMLLFIDFKFLWIMIQTAVGLVLVLGTASLLQIRRGKKQWFGYLKGIGWMLVSLPFVIGEIDLSIWFNRHDISHVCMMLCLFQIHHTVRKTLLPGQ